MTEYMDLDPTRTLQDLRSASDRLSRTEEADERLVSQMVGDFADLDQWISTGGYLPDQWRNGSSGRPRITEEGTVLTGVRHGTRTAYNAGCRCMRCRQANREAAAAYRARLKKEQRA